MRFIKSIPIIIALFLYLSVNAQIKDRLELGFNMGDFNHGILHESQINQSSRGFDLHTLPIELFANWYLKDKKTFLSLRYLRSYMGTDQYSEILVNNTKQNRYQEDFSIDGFYFGGGRDIFVQKKHELQTLLSCGYLLNQNRYSYEENFVENKLKSIYEEHSPFQHEITIQLQLKYKYNFYKKMYVSVGVNNALSYHFENGTYRYNNKQYDNGFLISDNSQNKSIKLRSLKFHSWQGFIGLGYKF